MTDQVTLYIYKTREKDRSKKDNKDKRNENADEANESGDGPE